MSATPWDDYMVRHREHPVQAAAHLAADAMQAGSSTIEDAVELALDMAERTDEASVFSRADVIRITRIVTVRAVVADHALLVPEVS